MAYVITLKPGKELFDKLVNIKNKAKELVGEQLYLADTPHITLYIANFNDVKVCISKIKQISQNNSSLQLNVKDWLIFENDPVTKGNTVAIKFDDSTTAVLKGIQMKIANSLNIERNNQKLKRYVDVELNETFTKNLNEYGYPFIGDIWLPHISIASFDKDKYDIVWSEIKDECPTGQFECDYIVLYELDENTDEIKKIEEFKLVGGKNA